MTSYLGQSSLPSSKSKSKVKPILRKFTQSEKNSLDLNRPAVEQGLGIYASSDYGTGSRSVHDVTFHTPRRGYHARSTSGTSQFSTATTGSGQRAGSFVHPFQQTPRPYTPPTAPSYSGSLLESDYSRESATQFDDEDLPPRQHPTSLRSASNITSSGSATPTLPSLRIQTKPSSRLNQGLSTSQSNIPSSLSAFPDLTTPSDTMSPVSVLRTSIDKGYRIRSHSNSANSYTDPRARSESIREARRKFEEKEQAKEVKAIEKQNLREARMIEKSGRRSSMSNSTTGRSKHARSRSDLRSQSHIQTEKIGEGFLGRGYDTAPVLNPPSLAEEGFEPPKRSATKVSKTKKGAQGAWMTFMMWLRTRLLRMGRKAGKD